MCVVSMIGDHFNDKYKNYPVQPWVINTPVPISRQEFDALRKEVQEMKALLIRAKKYDEDNNEPHCEMEDKVELLKKVAKYVGVDLKEVFGDENPMQSL